MTTGLHVGMAGVPLRFVITNHKGERKSVAAATTIELIITGPGGSSSTVPLTFSTDIDDAGDGTDGAVEYVLTGSEFPAKGRYRMETHVVIGAWDSRSQPSDFYVRDILT